MTAELAVVLPVVAVVLALCLGALRVGGEQLRLVDAAAAAARSLARGDAPASARRVAAALGPAAAFASRDRGEVVCVDLTASIPLAGPVTLPGSATGCALAPAA